MQPPIIFECQCGATHRSPDSKVPVGWSTSHGRSWCNDCTAAGVPAQFVSRQRRRA